MKRNSIIISAVVTVVVIIAVIFGIRQMTASAASTASTRAQTATVQRGNLIATVSAAGNVSAPTSATMAFQTAGRVAQVNVQVGDQVKAGQVLMALDPTDLQMALKTAQTNLSTAQISFESAKNKAAQNPNQLIAAKATLDKATIALQKAQSDYNAVAWRSDVGMTTQAQTLQNATIDYQTALANFNITASNINDTSSLRTAQAQVDNAQVSVDQAQRNLEKAKIVAPFDGLVATVNFNVGDSAGTGTAITLVDTAKLQVKVTIAEVDISKIKAGQTAQMTMDALAGKTYNAKVMTIGPVATVTQGVVNYPVTIAVSDNDGSIKPGMTANLAITVEQRENVLLVPLRAVRTQGNQKTVSVEYKGQTITMPVTTGLTNDTSVEITAGLQEGDQVLLNQTTTRQTGGGGIGGIGIPGAGPVFRGD